MPWAAMKLGRPVKWIEDRAEHFVATTHERGQVHDAEIALAADGRILGVQGRLPARHRRLRPVRPDRPDQQPVHAARALRRCRTTTATFTAVFTNKPIVTPYRGAGRQHGVFVIERLLDIAARELGHRPRGDPAAKLHPAGRFPVRQRDHLPGLHAARLRQRQLRADARQGAGDDRLRRFRPRGAAAAARGGTERRASASSATSRAPASAPTRARRCRCRRTAR